MFTKKTVVRAFEDLGNGAFVAIIAQVALEESAVLGSRTHRLTFDNPLEPVREHIARASAQFELGIEVPFPGMLVGLGLDERPAVLTYPPISADDIARIEAKSEEVWTPAVKAAFKAKRDAQKAEAERIEAEQAANAEQAVKAEQDRIDRLIEETLRRRGAS